MEKSGHFNFALTYIGIGVLALVTVATGFLDKHLCQKLTARIPGLYACDAAKARKELGYQTREFDSTLKDTISFLQAEEII